jgi:hypothetical protein
VWRKGRAYHWAKGREALMMFVAQCWMLGVSKRRNHPSGTNNLGRHLKPAFTLCTYSQQTRGLHLESVSRRGVRARSDLFRGGNCGVRPARGRPDKDGCLFGRHKAVVWVVKTTAVGATSARGEPAAAIGSTAREPDNTTRSRHQIINSLGITRLQPIRKAVYTASHSIWKAHGERG